MSEPITEEELKRWEKIEDLDAAVTFRREIFPRLLAEVRRLREEMDELTIALSAEAEDVDCLVGSHNTERDSFEKQLAAKDEEIERWKGEIHRYIRKKEVLKSQVEELTSELGQVQCDREQRMADLAKAREALGNAVAMLNVISCRDGKVSALLVEEIKEFLAVLKEEKE